MLLNYHVGRLVLSSLCVAAFVVGVFLVVFVLQAEACFSLQNEHHQKHINTKSSNTQRTENKTTDVVIQQHSRKLLKMDILMSETC